jgi:hypothetical protein
MNAVFPRRVQSGAFFPNGIAGGGVLSTRKGKLPPTKVPLATGWTMQKNIEIEILKSERKETLS